ncbi:MAG: thioredoxin domain-containing protein [Thermodesulfovibrionales bacterium]|nr:thioredoxin domain-containing protein [Thermodesulfovibrionales bacterium]
MNRLINEKSAYLRHAASQKIDWYPWSDEAFERAGREDKPVFLSSGAIWCHWCHVMAEESFNDEEVIEILNKDFICIKIDRDERPDIDRRLQLAVQAITGTGGWPLSVFLTPEGKPFFGGTYFPPDDRYGRPGFKRILKKVLDFYRKNKDTLMEQSSRLMDLISEKKTARGNLESDLIELARSAIISAYDPQNGGFGRAPKFPMPGTFEFLINRIFFEGNDSILTRILNTTLKSMAKGGIHDQIGGGFHRYSTDEVWIIPHFEKLCDDNAWLLRNYIDAYSLTGLPYYEEVAKGIINFIQTTLYDRDGGFYASQDADVTPDDEGGYFTWTYQEIKGLLDEKELIVITEHLFHEKGSMHHAPYKKVLFVVQEPEEIAEKLSMKTEEIREIISRAKSKLLAARRKRQEPFVDRNIYTSLNGMMITSFLKAARFLGIDDCEEVALKSLNRVFSIRYLNGELFHSENVKALLDDYIYIIEALLAAYESTGSRDYLRKASELMDKCIERFYDSESGGFFDTEEAVLGIRLKTIEDIPHPSANSLAIIMLLKLFHLTDKRTYLELAEDSLRAFSERAQEAGILCSYYFVALDWYLNMLRLSIYGGELKKTVLKTFRPYITIHYPQGEIFFAYEQKSYILPCLRERCLEPISEKEEFLRFIKEYK